MLNAFNQANFQPVNIVGGNPVTGIGGATLTGYQLTTLTGTNTSRVIQLVSRINW
jgi:hypothetical protein